MKFLILALPVILFSTHAKADVVNVRLGQNATLQAGDVAIIGNGKINSAITCGGQQEPEPQPQLPASQLFEGREVGKFSGIWQANAKNIGRDMAFSSMCGKNSFDTPIKEAQGNAALHARQACFQTGYTNCAPPMNQDEQFSFRLVGEREGEYGCLIKANIIGTMQ